MRKNSTKQPRNKLKQFIFDTVIIGIIILTLVIAGVFAGLNNNIARKARILEIFSSLNLEPQSYNLTGESIFGDKRVFSWDSSRSYASYRSYVHAADVDDTLEDLKNAIASTGFTFYDEPYPGSTINEFIYKSAKNEYLKIAVSSKLRDDAFFNASYMSKSTDNISISPNAGPSNVRIFVNLEDNNY